MLGAKEARKSRAEASERCAVRPYFTSVVVERYMIRSWGVCGKAYV
jgi:hypothetical protein